MARRVGYHVNRPGRRAEDEAVEIPIAADLKSVPGTPTRDNEITYYAREYPLESVAVEHSASSLWALDVREDAAPETAELYRQHQSEIEPVVEWLKSTRDMAPTADPVPGKDVTEAVRAKARELGYGEVGFTKFDRRYIYKSKRPYVRGGLGNAICLAVEQDYVATQSLPSLDAESAHGEAHMKQADMAKELVAFIHSLGYSAQAWGPTWHFGPMIPLFVQAGLGQLGINGQLLSPHFGSRARLQVITTDALITHDRPVDYGMTKFCELCHICSMRCPGRAINQNKVWFRGVEKSKLDFRRCRPVMTRYSGCGVCMKVCPVQRYGLPEVMKHYVATGEVLGKDSDNLEGYSLPGKGYFKPGVLPKFEAGFFDMPMGRSEDLVMDEYREAVEQMEDSQDCGCSEDDRDPDAEREALWAEFRRKLDSALERRDIPVDMGMDLGA